MEKFIENFDKVKECSICSKNYTGYGHNAWPINSGRCCDTCNTIHVLPMRIANFYKQNSTKQK